MDREEAIEIIRKNMPSDKSLPVYEAIQTLIPELAESAESEDERIRKAIIGIIKNSNIIDINVSEEQMLAYLEKQKDLDKMIVVSPEVWDNAISDAYENGKKDDEKQKELFESGRGLYYYDGEKTTYCGYPATEENPYNFAMRQQEKQKENKFAPQVLPCSAAWFEDDDEKQKEQKPVEINEYEIIKKHITDDSLSSEVNKRLKECGWYVTDEKPAERNESDTLMCNAALELLRSHPNLMASNGINKSSIIRWLQSFRPQRQGFIDDICSKAGISIPYLDGNQWCILKGDNIQSGVVGFGDTKEDALANFIKDVPIQQKWGKEDERIRKAILRFLNPDKGGTKYSSNAQLVEWSAWLKSLRPSWKPSEEQMRYLLAVINEPNNAGSESCHLTLKGLYEQLKKLK